MTNQAINVSSGQVYYGTTLTDGDTYYVYGGGEVISTTLNAKPANPSGGSNAPNGASIQIEGGLAVHTIVNSAATLYVEGGLSQTAVLSGTVQDTLVTSGGTSYVYFRGEADYTVISGATASQIVSGGVASGTVVVAGGSETVLVAGLDKSSIISSGGTITVSAGGVLSGATVLSGGSLFLSGGTAVDTMVLAGDPDHLFCDEGFTTGTVILSGGYDFIFSGDSTALSVHSGGVIFAQLSTVRNPRILGGRLDLGVGAVLSGVIAFDHETGASLQFSNAGASDATISGFNTGDTIEIFAEEAVSVTYAQTGPGVGRLTVFNGNGAAVDDFTLLGSYLGQTFSLLNPSSLPFGFSRIVVGPPARSIFTGDGRSDVLVQGDDGTVAVGLTAGLSVSGIASVASPGVAWRLIGSADFDGDGKADLVFQNTDGTLMTELLNGTTVTAQGSLGNLGATWHARSVADFNNDGRADVLMQNTSDGALALVATEVVPVYRTGC